jgi:hypothetical protein
MLSHLITAKAGMQPIRAASVILGWHTSNTFTPGGRAHHTVCWRDLVPVSAGLLPIGRGRFAADGLVMVPALLNNADHGRRRGCGNRAAIAEAASGPQRKLVNLGTFSLNADCHDRSLLDNRCTKSINAHLLCFMHYFTSF